MTEPNVVQPAINDLERRGLFGDEEHRPALAEHVGDQIADGLALAGSGRAYDDEVLTSVGGGDGRHLRRIRRQGCKEVGRLVAPVNVGTVDEGDFAWIRIARRVDEMLDDGV